ncbi:MAG: AmmeMemoRadiSam system protein B [Deltaproteobacteria bacterium]|nr:AmmeMemoRadiSam system protein B [Deltaproteobacteria bacterium]
MSELRPPAVAGQFYPAGRAELGAEIDRHLQNAWRPCAPLPSLKALIVPHAGYVYSGPVAAAAYAQLQGRRSSVERVVLMGPSHRVWCDGLAVSSADLFATPLGRIPVDREALERALELPQVALLDEAHDREHSLEVQLPFLQQVLGSFRLAPFSVGQASAEEVAEVLECLWDGPETVIVISTDLSHYLDYESARRIDAATAQSIEALRPEQLGSDQACGFVPLSGLLLVARRRGLHIPALDLRSSGDTAGPRDQVVGYGAWALA